MNDKGLFDKLAMHGEKEVHPEVDVAGDVLGTLALSMGGRMVSYRPLAWIAGVSSAAAACITLFVHFFFSGPTTDSMSEFYQAISWVTQ